MPLSNTEKILSAIKGLEDHLQTGEEPLATIPGIWDSIPAGESAYRAKMCEVVVTNQRLLGFQYTTFPRERLFLEAFPLSRIKILALHKRSFDPLFRELRVSNEQENTYIRSSREKIEYLNREVRSAIQTYAPHTTRSDDVTETAKATKAQPDDEPPTEQTTVYSQKELRTTFEQSHLGITVLFVGGLLLEIVGILAWAASRSEAVGLPLCLAGLFAVFIALLTRRQAS